MNYYKRAYQSKLFDSELRLQTKIFLLKKPTNSLRFTSILLVFLPILPHIELPARRGSDKLLILQCRKPRILHENF